MTKFKLDAQYYFGKDVVEKYLSRELEQRKIKTVLLAYGGGSIKQNGLYNQIINACKETNTKIVEHFGIEPNPRDIGIYQAALKCRKHKVDLIIAAGGGSVIDASKIIGILATNPQYKDC
jgi:alcohol dehydrogenase YqhD (iron-dependent ADH family)